MRRIGQKNTEPELTVRRLLHFLGYRFRLHRKDLPGTPDIVFPGRKKIIFVHGCFWHQHQDVKCKKTKIPRTNTDYWIPKLKKNVERDKMQQSQLLDLGWNIFVVWECETKDIEKLAKRLVTFLESG